MLSEFLCCACGRNSENIYRYPFTIAAVCCTIGKPIRRMCAAVIHAAAQAGVQRAAALCPSESTQLYGVKYSELYFAPLQTSPKCAIILFRDVPLCGFPTERRNMQMSFAICRIQKIGGAKDIVGIEIHNQRKREHSNSNPDIDHSRSELNVQLAAPNGSYNATVDEIIKKHYKGKRAIRKDAVRLCEVLFTSDKDFFDKSEDGGKAYLMACYEWALERFGKDNLVAATVHMDEETPHMHFDFVPMTEDGRLSAKAVMGGRVDLQRLQDDFYEQVGKRFGMDRGERTDIEGGEKGRTHQDTADYKRKKHQEEIDKLSPETVKDIDSCLKIEPLEVIEKKEKSLFSRKEEPAKVVLKKKDYVRMRKALKASKGAVETSRELIAENEELKAELRKHKAAQSERMSRSFKKLTSKERVNASNKNSILCNALGVPENATYDETFRILRDKGYIKQKSKQHSK